MYMPKNWCFWTWCWRRLLRVPWTAKRSNQLILKEISSEYSLKGLMLKMKHQSTWCEQPTQWKRSWCWERLKARGEGDDRGWDGWMVSPTRWTWVWASSGSWWWIGRPDMLQSMVSQRVGHNWANELNWTYTINLESKKVEKHICPQFYRNSEFLRATVAIFLPWKSHGQRSLVGYSPWGHKGWTWLIIT